MELEYTKIRKEKLRLELIQDKKVPEGKILINPQDYENFAEFIKKASKEEKEGFYGKS